MKRKVFTVGIGALAFIGATVFMRVGAGAQTISTIAGTGVGAFSGEGTLATAAQLRNPYGIKANSLGDIYFADYLNHRIRKIDASGIISTFAGSGVGGFGGDGGTRTAAQLFQPAGLAWGGGSYMYISDYGNNRIRKIDVGTGIITTIAGGASAGYSGDGGAATAALLSGPTGINTDAAGDVYFAEQGNHVIRKITIATGIISTVAGNGTAGYTGDGGAATAAKLNQPKDVVVDASGNLYIAGWLNNSIRKVSTSGTITTIAGGMLAGFSGDGGPAASALLNNPISICIDENGNLLFVDNGNARVRKINTGDTITTVAGNGSFGFAGDGGLATAAKINGVGVSTDGLGNIYIADGSNHRIRKVDPAPVTISGTANVCEGATTTLTGSMSGGTWSSSTPSVASVDAAGVVSGLSMGTATITYTTYTGEGTQVVAVNPIPPPITGIDTVCVAATTTLTTGVPGGTWESSMPAVASVTSAGVVSGVSAGGVLITFTSGGGCKTFRGVTVNSCTTTSGINGAAENENGFSIYPNPSTGAFSVVLPAGVLPATITVTDMLGKVVYNTTQTASSNVKCHMNNVPQGSYIIKIGTGDKVYRTKITVVN